MLLVRPSVELKDKILHFKNEFISHDEKVINGGELLDKTDSFENWLEYVSNNTCKDTLSHEWVLTDIYFALVDDKIVGVICLRHYLNDLLHDFGHIAYSVSPSERKKGYATLMLSQVLSKAKNMGMARVKLSAKKGNIASVKTIINNNGVYSYSFEYDNDIVDVYSIKL